VPFLYYNLGCYHENDPYRLAFFDMTSFTLVGIHVTEKKEGIYAFICLVSPNSLGCYHENDPSGLAFFDMMSFTLVCIHVTEKKEGIYAYICSVSPISLDLFYLV